MAKHDSLFLKSLKGHMRIHKVLGDRCTSTQVKSRIVMELLHTSIEKILLLYIYNYFFERGGKLDQINCGKSGKSIPK